jgi:hypothetical protein
MVVNLTSVKVSVAYWRYFGGSEGVCAATVCVDVYDLAEAMPGDLSLSPSPVILLRMLMGGYRRESRHLGHEAQEEESFG